VKPKVFVILFVSVSTILVPCASAQHWYSWDEQVPLAIDSLKIVVKVDFNYSPNNPLQEIGRLAEVLEDSLAPYDFVACSLYSGSGYEAFLDSLETLPEIILVEPYYLNAIGIPTLVGECFCVGFDATWDQAEIENLNDSLGVETDRQLSGLSKVYVLKNTKDSGRRLLDLANLYHDLPGVEFAHPDFQALIVRNSYSLYDYYADYQPHTKKIIGSFNEASVWDFGGFGRPVKVAVIDDGVVVHEDLPTERVLPGYDYASGNWKSTLTDDDPSPGLYQAHGMACTGIIAGGHTTDSVTGLNTNSGVISMNPNVQVIPVKIFHDDGSSYNVTDSKLAEAVSFAVSQGAEVLSNSWSWRNPDEPNHPVLDAAFWNAVDYGRYGLGCVVVFSSGNTDSRYPDPEGVCYPARAGYGIAVGAVTLDDERWDYSRYGPELRLVAPSDDGYTLPVWGLDQMQEYGFNPYEFSDCPAEGNDMDYNCHFGGTSAACPLVSGTASLLLAKDSTLTDNEVSIILLRSAIHLPPFPDPSPETGHGRVDAYRAVLSIARGDTNNDGVITIGDVSLIINYLFVNQTPLFPDRLLGDVNCDGDVTTGDISRMLDYLFIGGPEEAPLEIPCFNYGE